MQSDGKQSEQVKKCPSFFKKIDLVSKVKGFDQKKRDFRNRDDSFHCITL